MRPKAALRLATGRHGGHLFEYSISERVPPGIVHLFELIQIEREQRDLRLRAGGR
jgi:hypothetical protein